MRVAVIEVPVGCAIILPIEYMGGNGARFANMEGGWNIRELSWTDVQPDMRIIEESTIKPMGTTADASGNTADLSPVALPPIEPPPANPPLIADDDMPF